MNKSVSIQLNMMMNVLLTLSSIIFPLITLPYVTGILGPQGMGRVYFASSVIAFFSIFAEIGIPVYGIRACARVKNDNEELTKTAREIMTVNLIACLASYAVLFICILIIPRLSEDRLLFAVLSSSMILNVVGAEWLYKALEKYTYITVRSLIFKTIAVAAIFMTINSSTDYVLYGFLTISAAAASNIVNMMNLHKHIGMKSGGHMDLRRHLPGMMALFSLAAAATIYANLDIAFLDFIKGDTEAGLYGIAVKVKLVMVNLITSVSAVLLPRVSYLKARDEREQYMKLLKNTMSGVNILSVPLTCFFIIFADKCVMILAGQEFSGSVMPMRIIMPAVFIIGISSILGMQMLIPMGKEKAVSRAAWAGALIDILLNAILIPRFASSGAAFATLSAEILVLICLIKAAGRDASCIIKPDVLTASVTSACIASVLPVVVIKDLKTGELATLVIAAGIFFAVYSIIIFAINNKHELLH